jgi:hypothetical protein
MDHLINPEIVKQFEWDAQKVSMHDGERSARIFTEPWTGERFWDIQVRDPNDSKTTLTSHEVIIAGGRKNAVP